FSIVMECGFSNSGGNSLGEIELKFLKSLQSNLQTDEDFRDKDPLVINFLSERIVDNVAMINEKEVSFQVKPNQVEMSVIIIGNVSRIELKMPIGELEKLYKLD
ncbi:uncharacterized protein LOC106646372, partial [Copidosoma floridanum]|uniref:uncharacterized protein LOC106646372 n=1 Tax=Copidosoma floridanum TaxID=29053 RepID=UPI0006C9720F